jgi:hypothetical protein
MTGRSTTFDNYSGLRIFLLIGVPERLKVKSETDSRRAALCVDSNRLRLSQSAPVDRHC